MGDMEKLWQVCLMLVASSFVATLALKSEGFRGSSRSKSWVTLGDAKFDSVPREAFEEYMGSPGAGVFRWDIWHNFEGNSSTNNDESMWLLGYATRDFYSFDKKILSQGGSPSLWAASRVLRE